LLEQLAVHTGSHARQPRQNEACSASVGSPGGSVPDSSARIKLILPRGEDASSAVSAYVGQAGRQKPQEMQRLSSVGSKIEPACDTLSLVIRTPAFRD
jgi:hypothetical protein